MCAITDIITLSPHVLLLNFILSMKLALFSYSSRIYKCRCIYIFSHQQLHNECLKDEILILRACQQVNDTPEVAITVIFSF